MYPTNQEIADAKRKRDKQLLEEFALPNTTCAHCDKRFRMIPHVINRKKREGKHTFCSQQCVQRARRQAERERTGRENWLNLLDPELANAIRLSRLA
jgi:hypothetical protein